MSLNLTEFSGSVTNITNLPDKPSLESSELKALFDKSVKDLKDYINLTLLPELETAIDSKVDAETGKSLISNTLITKLNGIEEGATKNVITNGTNDPSGGNNNDIYLQYDDENEEE